ncbi:DUF1836 domain-containing protein [Paenalkalicoccus suaedae]|uniref:DUF1836 domain-containing protein n=1 Tax=Paenalkalicoccus suaedae TaxID=2592382 RepID=A0A859FAX2_9BACI|nr:DUF1836 domain-containing protein [Paenalkalicoccus suaedae]QKS70090.1 DUF1836 domain-containing protein [Paenalkalicoccus suaedae]
MSLTKYVQNLPVDEHIEMEKIPELDLYMDQVIQLFDLAFHNLKRDEKEKIITKTMINNYAKGDLIFPIKNKRYTREHIMIIGLIYELKGTLALKDIERTLTHVHLTGNAKKETISSFYKDYLDIAKRNAEHVKEDMTEHARELEEQLAHLDPYVQQVLLILSFVHQSNLYRKAAEMLIDTLPEKTK